MSHLLLIACHTNSLIKKKSLLNNIRYFTELCNNIVIIQSIECKDMLLENNIKNLNKNIIFYYIPNDKFICQGKWSNYLNNINYKKYDNITLTNDSYLITKSLNNYKKLINKNVELVALLDSFQLKYHYPDFLRTYNKVGIKKILSYYDYNKDKINSFDDAIIHYEVNSSKIFNNVKVLYPNNTRQPFNIHFNNVELEKYLYNLNYPIIKIKKLLINKYMNKNMPSDFNELEYKTLHSDVSHMNSLQLKNHFLKHGMNEGRVYKINQAITLPTFLTNYLKNNNLLFVINYNNTISSNNKSKKKKITKLKIQQLNRLLHYRSKYNIRRIISAQ